MAKPITHLEFLEQHPTLTGRVVEAIVKESGKTFLSVKSPSDDEVKNFIDKGTLVTFGGDIYTIYAAYAGDRKPDGSRTTRNSITFNCDKRAIVF